MNVREPGGLTGIAWRKSSFSSANGNCVEMGWRKSSFSSANGDCVEVAPMVAGVAVRDSKQNDGPTLAFPQTDWRAFLTDLA
ncbi:DUF397 domain-containing protein [Actinokineospora sp.]|uniref:DUF397 domain-containing protein n=1 Tax=Actinokineospora sp. TaxID=1872133 RepID=UPI004037E0A3